MPYQFEDYSARLLKNEFSRPAVEAAISALDVRQGGRVLDVGCGAGAHFALLLAATGRSGEVIGIDLTPGHLEAARRQATTPQLSGRVHVREADLRRPLPFAPNSFDLIWVSNVISPKTVGDPIDFVGRLKDLLRPAGTLAIFESYGVRPCFLPGYPRLEHLIGLARCLKREEPGEEWRPEWHPESALYWAHAIHLENIQQHIFLLHYQAPLPPAIYSQIRDEVLCGYYADVVASHGRQAGMTDEDLSLWHRLSDPSDPAFVLNQPGYYCVAHALLTSGKRDTKDVS